MAAINRTTSLLKISTLILLAALIGCGGTQQISQRTALISPAEQPKLVKVGAIFPWMGELTPVIWKGNLLVTSTDLKGSLDIYDFFTRQRIVHVSAPDMAMTSSIVWNDRLYVFGATKFHTQGYRTDPGNAVIMISSDDLMNWTAPVVVFQAAPSQSIYNTSVAPDPTGFVMTMETLEPPSFPDFHERFAHSTDLNHFDEITGILGADFTSYCPSIRFVNGYYYAIHTGVIFENGARYFITYISRSHDLVSWEHSPEPLLTPRDNTTFEVSPSGEQAISDSDVDLVEFNGTVYMVYVYSDQATWAGWALATYRGTEAQLFEGFFH